MGIEYPNAIQQRWRREGRAYTSGDIFAEYERQETEFLAERDQQILDAARQPTASEHTREVAGQISDRRHDEWLGEGERFAAENGIDFQWWRC